MLLQNCCFYVFFLLALNVLVYILAIIDIFADCMQAISSKTHKYFRVFVKAFSLRCYCISLLPSQYSLMIISPFVLRTLIERVFASIPANPSAVTPLFFSSGHVCNLRRIISVKFIYRPPAIRRTSVSHDFLLTAFDASKNFAQANG